MKPLKIKLSRIALMTGIATLALATTAHSQTLTGQQIMDTHIGKCMSYWGESEGTECFRANGNASYKDKTYGNDKGRWKIFGNKICVKYSKAEETECKTYKKLSDGTYTDGSYTWRIVN